MLENIFIKRRIERCTMQKLNIKRLSTFCFTDQQYEFLIKHTVLESKLTRRFCYNDKECFYHNIHFLKGRDLDLLKKGCVCKFHGSSVQKQDLENLSEHQLIRLLILPFTEMNVSGCFFKCDDFLQLYSLDVETQQFVGDNRKMEGFLEKELQKENEETNDSMIVTLQDSGHKIVEELTGSENYQHPRKKEGIHENIINKEEQYNDLNKNCQGNCQGNCQENCQENYQENCQKNHSGNHLENCQKNHQENCQKDEGEIMFSGNKNTIKSKEQNNSEIEARNEQFKLFNEDEKCKQISLNNQDSSLIFIDNINNNSDSPLKSLQDEKTINFNYNESQKDKNLLLKYPKIPENTYKNICNEEEINEGNENFSSFNSTELNIQGNQNIENKHKKSPINLNEKMPSCPKNDSTNLFRGLKSKIIHLESFEKNPSGLLFESEKLDNKKKPASWGSLSFQKDKFDSIRRSLYEINQKINKRKTNPINSEFNQLAAQCEDERERLNIKVTQKSNYFNDSQNSNIEKVSPEIVNRIRKILTENSSNPLEKSPKEHKKDQDLSKEKIIFFDQTEESYNLNKKAVSIKNLSKGMRNRHVSEKVFVLAPRIEECPTKKNLFTSSKDVVMKDKDSEIPCDKPENIYCKCFAVKPSRSNSETFCLKCLHPRADENVSKSISEDFSTALENPVLKPEEEKNSMIRLDQKLSHLEDWRDEDKNILQEEALPNFDNPNNDAKVEIVQTIKSNTIDRKTPSDSLDKDLPAVNPRIPITTKNITKLYNSLDFSEAVHSYIKLDELSTFSATDLRFTSLKMLLTPQNTMIKLYNYLKNPVQSCCFTEEFFDPHIISPQCTEMLDYLIRLSPLSVIEWRQFETIMLKPNSQVLRIQKYARREIFEYDFKKTQLIHIFCGIVQYIRQDLDGIIDVRLFTQKQSFYTCDHFKKYNKLIHFRDLTFTDSKRRFLNNLLKFINIQIANTQHTEYTYERGLAHLKMCMIPIRFYKDVNNMSKACENLWFDSLLKQGQIKYLPKWCEDYDIIVSTYRSEFANIL